LLGGGFWSAKFGDECPQKPRIKSAVVDLLPDPTDDFFAVMGIASCTQQHGDDSFNSHG